MRSPLPSLVAVCVLILAPGLAAATPAPGPDAFGYTVAPNSQFTFLQITNGSPRVLWFADDDTVTVNIGFNFNFYGTNYSTVSFSPNGLLTFVAPCSQYSNVDLTASAPTNNVPCIAVLWDDWETQDPWSDGVYYKTTGASGSHQFIVQWNKVVPVNGAGTNTVTFEARLFEGNNRILFSYFDAVVSDESTLAASLGVGATVGIQDASGQTNNRNLEWSYKQAVITNGLNLLFSLPNHPPIASNDLASTSENTPVSISVLANDRDPDGDPLTIVAITPGANGLVTTNANSTVTYRPSTNFFGTDQFTYTVSDGQGGSATGMVSVIVSPVNQPPTLGPLSNVTLDEDAAPYTVNLTGITSGATHESDMLTVTASSSNPGLMTNLSVSYTSPNATGSLSFGLVTNAFGTATIRVAVSDGQASNNLVSRLFTVTVNPVNDPPALDPLSNLTLKEDAPPQTISLTGITSGAANENDTLTVTASSSNPALVTNASVSYVSPNPTGSLTFTLVTNSVGTADITVTVNDGQASNNIISRSFSVIVNPPVLTTVSIERQSNGSIVLRFHEASGMSFEVEASTDLMIWMGIGVASEGNPGEFEFEDTGAVGLPARFYRLRAL